MSEEHPAPFHIVNPEAGGGKVARRWERLGEALAARGLISGYALTESPGHGYELATQAIRDGISSLVAVGGDGTVFESINAVMDCGAAEHVRVGTIPMGAGNDAARCLGMPRAAQAMKAIADRSERRLDIGRVESNDSSGRLMVKHFIVQASAGWVPEVSSSVPKTLKRLGDTAPYVLMAALKLAGPLGRDFVVELDDEFFDGRYNTISIHNMEYWGGTLRAAPGASPDDGLFDVIRWADLGRRAVIRAIQGQRKGGTHLRLEGVDRQHARSIGLAAGRRTALDLDGEHGGYLPAKISILPRAIRFIAPPPDGQLTP
jgi:diacylglycerol kinase (ATP)